jgi:hypothetical protein
LRWRRPATLVAAAVLATAVAGCESSQDRSAELKKEGGNTLRGEKGLQVGERNPSVKVLGSTVLTDKNGSAVVVSLKNDGSAALKDVPIAIDVLGANHKKVFTNTTPGLQKALQTVPLLPPGKPVEWVNDQVFPSAKPKSVKVTVGSSTKAATTDPSAVTVSKPTIANDPVSGIEANGTITNNTGTEQDALLLFAVARKGGKIVAAGRGGVKKVRPKGEKPAHFHVFFIGDPRGADVTVNAYPNELR